MADLRPVWDDDKFGMDAGTFLDVELGIALLLQVCPHEPATSTYELLSGYPFLDALGIDVSQAARDSVAVARHLLGPLQKRRDWETAIANYRAVPEDVCGYRLDDNDRARPRSVSVATTRFDTYERALSEPPDLSRRSIMAAPAGAYVVSTRESDVSVVIPDDVASVSLAKAHDLTARADRDAITFTWTELAETAEQLDQREITANLPADDRGHWARRFRRLELRIRKHETFTNADKLTISGILHLIGMVGAGKSTLMMLLAVRAAHRGLHVTLVLGDVLSSLRTTTWLGLVGVSAAPILGVSRQQRHIDRLHQVHAATARGGDAPALGNFEPASNLLSTACALDALRSTSTPWDFRDAPCRDNLTQVNYGSRYKRFGCPLWAKCQRHANSRECVSASIWVATPASLVHSRVPQELNPEQLRYLELVWRRSDLVIIDEADQVQAQLDGMFSPGQTLIGHDNEAWLEALMDHTERELRGSGRAQFDKRQVREWSTQVNTARTTANRLYALLSRNPLPRGGSTIVRWISRDCFTEWTLADKLVRQWAGIDAPDPDNDSYRTMIAGWDQFLTDPLGRRDRAETSLASQLVELTRALVNLADEDECARLVTNWLYDADIPQLPSDQDVSEIALRVEFTALLAVLSNTLNSLIRGWRAVEMPLNFDTASGLMFQRPPEDYTPVVPASPMGNVLGYQYRDEPDEQGRMGRLRFFRCSGVGRWVLLNLHQLFRPDSHTGPAVLLMSGTSWAGTSPRYDVQVPVGAILKAPDNELAAVDKSEFFIEPVFDQRGNPIAVSGRQGDQRRQALRAILRWHATQQRPGHSSRFEAELSDLAEDRRRILLLVGSYAEAREVAEDLVEIRGDWRGHVLHLVADESDFTGYWTPTLRRGEVSRLASTDATFLIAPLLAIERGHNILNADGEAAIGSAYFLIRPHPRPDDISYPVQAMNRWAVDHIEKMSHQRHAHGGDDIVSVARAFRSAGYRRWQRMLTEPLVYGSLDIGTDRPALAWTQLVTIWQVIGRLVRGGSSARVHFCDAKFVPDSRDPDASLLVGMYRALDQYLAADARCSQGDRELAEALYGPFHRALARTLGEADAPL